MQIQKLDSQLTVNQLILLVVPQPDVKFHPDQLSYVGINHASIPEPGPKFLCWSRFIDLKFDAAKSTKFQSKCNFYNNGAVSATWSSLSKSVFI